MIQNGFGGDTLGFARRGDPASADTLFAGQQLLLEDTTVSFAFAGQQLELAGFSGVLSYSAETAFVLVIEGSAAIGRHSARRGRILIIPPFGSTPDVGNYDAERFAEQWTAEAAVRHPAAHASLQRLAGRQSNALFIGRLGRTALNLAAPGGAQGESARRSVVGEPAVMAIRYSSAEDYAAIGHAGQLFDALLSGRGIGVKTAVSVEPRHRLMESSRRIRSRAAVGRLAQVPPSPLAASLAAAQAHGNSCGVAKLMSYTHLYRRSFVSICSPIAVEILMGVELVE